MMNKVAGMPLNEDSNKQYSAIYIKTDETTGEKLFNLYETTNIVVNTPRSSKSKYYWFRPTEIKQVDNIQTANYRDGGFIESLLPYSETFKDNLNYIYIVPSNTVIKLIEKSIPEKDLPKNTIILW